MMDDEPRLARCMARLGSFARLIRFDRRGIGLSDPVSPRTPPTLEQWVGDAIAVLGAVESGRAIVLASAETASVGLLFAATHPERVDSCRCQWLCSCPRRCRLSRGHVTRSVGAT